ncbi:threonine-phosphate decarboxylase CobD [Morganella morganii]|uniref:threonine-phosphate decarboxylase CobD n=1 Tax=Morganella morganii TaxID=582 RepID=UPI0021F2048E|nr:threonine-phosphate decarboxylase CobD [Morganella morganii]
MEEAMSEHGGNVVEVAELLGISPASIFDFSANINPLGPPERVKAIIRDNLSVIERYPDIEYRYLHAALAKGAGCELGQVIAGNGETELIYALVRHLNPHSALLLTPGFAEYRRALEQQGCDIIEHPLTEESDFQPDESLLADIEARRPDCVFIATPNNPTGLMPDTALLHKLVSLCESRHIHLIVDEAFIDFMPEGSPLTARLPETRYLYLLRSLTKFFAIPGLRLGYLLCGDSHIISNLKAWREPWTINGLAALVGEVLLDDEDYIRKTQEFIAAQREYLCNELRQFPLLKIRQPTANYIFIRCLNGVELQSALLKYKLLIRRCQNYPGLDGSYYRIAVRSQAENRHLIGALKQVFQHG